MPHPAIASSSVPVPLPGVVLGSTAVARFRTDVPPSPAEGGSPSTIRPRGDPDHPERGWLRTVLDLVLPVPCPGCGAPAPWCRRCAALLDGPPRMVRLSEAALDAAGGLPLPGVRALARYAGPVRAAVIAGKERGRSDLPPLLGAAVGRALVAAHRRHAHWVPDGETVWIVPAPSRATATRARGQDAVAVMAGAAARSLAAAGIAAGVAPCVRTAGPAADSVGLAATERVANLAGRIHIRPRGLPPPGAAVILLDDVVTSGATAVATVAALSRMGVPVAAVLAVAAAAPWRRVR